MKKRNPNQLDIFQVCYNKEPYEHLAQLLNTIVNIKYEEEKQKNIEYLNSLSDSEFFEEMNEECIFKTDTGEVKKDWKRELRALSANRWQTNSQSDTVPSLSTKQYKTLLELLKNDYDSFSSLIIYCNTVTDLSWQEWEQQEQIKSPRY